VGVAAAYAAFLLIATPRGFALSPDAVDYAEAARSLSRGQGDVVDRIIFHTGLFPTVRHPLEVHGELQQFVLAALFVLGGPNPALVRIPGVVFAATLIVLSFVVGRRLFGTIAGLVAVCFVLSSRELVMLALFFADDVPHALFSFAAVGAFTIGATSESNRKAWLTGAGVASAFSALAKFTGTIFPAVFGVLLIVHPKTRRAVGLRGFLRLALPVLVVVALYTWRNYRVYGTPGSPYGAVEWLGKDGMPNYFALYDPTPTVAEVWAKKGAAHMFGLIRMELASFVSVVFHYPLLLAGVPATAWLLRRNVAWSGSILLYLAGLCGVTSVTHHVEARYLSALMPFSAVSVGACATEAFCALQEKVVDSRRRWTRAALVVLVGAVLSRAIVAEFLVARAFAIPADGEEPCAAAIRFLRSDLAPNTVVLSSNPWLVSWAAERPSVNAPTNGAAAFLTVARHYGARWMMVDRSFSYADFDALLHEPSIVDALRPERVVPGPRCDVYRLHTPSP